MKKSLLFSEPVCRGFILGLDIIAGFGATLGFGTMVSFDNMVDFGTMRSLKFLVGSLLAKIFI